jgi:predicted dehydrogenase
VGQGPVIQEDKACIVLTFTDGSIGTINYFANGAKSYPKETLQIFFDGKVLVNENFRVTRAFGIKGFRTFKTLRQDKGHSQEIAAFVRYLSVGGEKLMPFESLRNVTLATFAAAKSANDGRIISL